MTSDSSADARTLMGGDGGSGSDVTAFDSADAGPDPRADVAVTVNRSVTFNGTPDTTIDTAAPPRESTPPPDTVTTGDCTSEAMTSPSPSQSLSTANATDTAPDDDTAYAVQLYATMGEPPSSPVVQFSWMVFGDTAAAVTFTTDAGSVTPGTPDGDTTPTLSPAAFTLYTVHVYRPVTPTGTSNEQHDDV